MLIATKSSTLRGDSVIEGIKVMSFTAEISSQELGNSTTRATILNQEMYAKNRVQCRQDQAEFQERVYLIEDKFIEEGFSNSNEGEELTK